MPLRFNPQRLRPAYILKPRGKNLKITYYLRSSLRSLTPNFWLKARYSRLLSNLSQRPDFEEIQARVDYYNKLQNSSLALTKKQILRDIPNKGSVYNRDVYEFTRYFSPDLYIDTAFGDNTLICLTPSITKSRPINGDNAFDVLLNLDKVRHFTFLKDKTPFRDKLDKAIFRGATCQAHRHRFMKKFFGSELVDCGDTSKKISAETPAEWKKPLITLYDHLKYKFVVCLEGNDVASNLKWVMSSNSLALMPKPKYETWFMEGQLIPNVHYVEIRDDYADVEEKIRYYAEHVDEAETIIRNAHEFVDRFRNAEREDIISLLVLKKYFEKTGQSV